MKQIIFTALAALLTIGVARAEDRTVTVVDSVNNQTKVIELTDNVVNGKTVTDTVSITTYPGTNIDQLTQTSSVSRRLDDWPMDEDNDGLFQLSQLLGTAILVPLIGIIFGIGLPVLIIILVINNRHKRRMAKYRLAEKALNAGQQLPAEFFGEISVQNKRSRGIANAFLGIGLFAFLYALTQEFALGCIGILVFCIGLGQVVSFYAEQRDKAHNDGTTNRPNRQPSTGSPNEPAGSSQPTAYDKPADNPEQTDQNPDNTTLNEQ